MSETKNTLLTGGITQEQFDKWTKEIGVPNEDFFRGKIISKRTGNPLYFFFKKPSKSVVALAMTHIMDKKPLAAADEFRNNCLLYAENELTTDEKYKDEYLQSIGKTIGEQFDFIQAEVEKI